MNIQTLILERNVDTLVSSFGSGSGSGSVAPLMLWIAAALTGIVLLLAALATMKSKSPIAGAKFAGLVAFGWLVCSTFVLIPFGLYFFQKAAGLLGTSGKRS